MYIRFPFVRSVQPVYLFLEAPMFLSGRCTDHIQSALCGSNIMTSFMNIFSHTIRFVFLPPYDVKRLVQQKEIGEREPPHTEISALDRTLTSISVGKLVIKSI